MTSHEGSMPAITSPLTKRGYEAAGGSLSGANALRAAGAMNGYVSGPLGGSPRRPQSRDWANATGGVCADAKHSKHMSHQLRESSTSMRKQTDRQTKEQQHYVDDMLRKKVQETTHLKKKIEGRLVGLQAELDKLAHTRSKATALADNLKRPVRKNENRTSLRDRRPVRERIEDRVHRSLDQERSELKIACGLLDDYINQADGLLMKMNACKQSLKDDHTDKARSLKLDLECLDLPAKAGAEKQRDDLMEPKASTATPLSPPVADLGGSPLGKGPAAVGKSGTLPGLWKQNTERLAAESAKLEHESCELRKKISNILKSVDECQQQNAQNVRDSLSLKLKNTETLQRKLNTQLLEINSEVDELAEQREQVRRALDAKRVPLGILTKRLLIRRQRPARETVRDQVEIALEQEHEQLVATINKLETKLRNIDQEMDRMKNQASNLESDIRDKTQAFNIDRRCQELSCQDSRQSTPSLPSHGSDVGGLAANAANAQQRAALLRLRRSR